MSEHPRSNGGRVLVRALWASLVGIGLVLASVGVAEEGLLRLVGIGLGTLTIILAFTGLPKTWAVRMFVSAGERQAYFWAIFLSIGSILVPLMAAFFPASALLAGAPLTQTFGALIIGPAISVVLNLVVLALNLLGYRLEN